MATVQQWRQSNSCSGSHVSDWHRRASLVCAQQFAENCIQMSAMHQPTVHMVNEVLKLCESQHRYFSRLTSALLDESADGDRKRKKSRPTSTQRQV